LATRSHVIFLKFPLATTHNSPDVVGLTGGGAVGTTRGGLVGCIGLTVLTGVGLGVGFTTLGISGIRPQVLQHAF